MALVAAPALGLSLLAAAPSPAVTTDGLVQTTPTAQVADLESLPGDDEPVAVTLITGDTVYWSDAGGNASVKDIEVAPRSYPVYFDQSRAGEDFYVIPDDVREFVVSGTLDRELFNIPSLIRQGLDDQSTGGELPVIVTFDTDASAAKLERDAAALPAASQAQGVERIRGAAVKVDRGKAAQFREAVLGRPEKGRSPSAQSASLPSGVDKVYLDAILEIDLAESVPQIGAPAAWDAGFTGEGIMVAVLDTGVDSTHPDLEGQVTEAVDFTGEGDPSDVHGHGTHVASTIAGTGAASVGQYSGVAPDADLMSGRVCGSDGRCQISDLMAGMEWAANNGADIVNMSLSSEFPSDGTDIQSQLLNELSADTGTLFVTSAGNAAGFQAVGAPAAADAALAVGAVDKSDQMASFSSRGPRIGDNAVKPEITAPGVGIVAARGAGTGLGNPVDDDYTSSNGTSMASPHVAAAAALLAQARPELDGQELKDALVSTAVDVGHLWFEQGAGRVQVPDALNSAVYAQGTVHFADLDVQTEQELTYTSHAAEDITLSLELGQFANRDGQPTDGVSLSADTITVPAGGEASVTVAVNPDQVAGVGPFGGVIMATGNGVALRTAVGFGEIQPKITIEVLDSNGERIGTDTVSDIDVKVINDTFDPDAPVGFLATFVNTVGGIASLKVRPGIYTFIATVIERDLETGGFARENHLIQAEVLIEGHATVTLDSRETVRVDVTTPLEVEPRAIGYATIKHQAGGFLFDNVTHLFAARPPERWVTPTPPGRLASTGFTVRWVLAEPKEQYPAPWVSGTEGSCSLNFFTIDCYSAAPRYVYDLLFTYDDGIPTDLHEEVTRDDLVAVPSRYHSDNPDAFVRLGNTTREVSDGYGIGGTSAIGWVIQPGEVTEYYLADDDVLWERFSARQTGSGRSGPVFVQRSIDRFQSAEAGKSRQTENFHAAPSLARTEDRREDAFLKGPGVVGPAGPQLLGLSRGGPTGNTFYTNELLGDNVRGHHGGQNFGSCIGCRVFRSSYRMWNADTGKEVVNSNTAADPSFQLVPEEATYRLERVEVTPEEPVTLRELQPTAPVATTTWTFTSRPSSAPGPDGYDCERIAAGHPRNHICQAQPLNQLEYNFGLDIHNRAPAGRVHAFTITAGHHSKAIDRAKVTDLSVQASFDDGETWTNAQVVSGPTDTVETGGYLPSSAPYQKFEVELEIPPLADTNSFVALRVQAGDANGGTIDQTVHRAYILKEADDGGGEEASFESLRELVESFAADGGVTRRGESRLLRLVSLAERFGGRGQTGKAIKWLEKFQDLAAEPKLVSSDSARDALVGEAERLIAQLAGDTPDGGGSSTDAGRSSAGGGEVIAV